MVAMGNVDGSGVWPTSFGHTPLPYRYVLLNCFAIALRSLSFFDWLESGFAAVFRHHLRLQLLRAWRRPCNGVRTCFDGGENAFFGTAS